MGYGGVLAVWRPLAPHESESDVFDIVWDNSLRLVLMVQELIIVTGSVIKPPHFPKYDPHEADYRPGLPSLIPLCIYVAKILIKFIDQIHYTLILQNIEKQENRQINTFLSHKDVQAAIFYPWDIKSIGITLIESVPGWHLTCCLCPLR